MSHTEVTIIIPNYNNRSLLVDLIESLKDVKTGYDLIIVDDNSQDDSAEYITENYPGIKLLVNNENHGFAYTVNRGIKHAETRYVYLLNNDTKVTPDTLDNALKVIRSDSSIYAVSSKMIQFNNHDLIEDAGDEYTILGWSKKRGYDRNITEYDKTEPVFSACAGACLYRKEVFTEIGYFDENFGSYVEDMDLSFRIRLHGYDIYYAHDSLVYHYGSATTGSQHNPFKVENSARNNIYLIYKNMSLWMKIINFIFIITGIIIKYIYFRHKNLGKYYLKGIRDGLNTRNKLTKTGNIPFVNYLKIEVLIMINTLRYLK